MFFFFFKQKTAYEMRISDWSSDVCSSDLGEIPEVVSLLRVVGVMEETRAALLRVEGRDLAAQPLLVLDEEGDQLRARLRDLVRGKRVRVVEHPDRLDGRRVDRVLIDRKSTRLNSSH